MAWRRRSWVGTAICSGVAAHIFEAYGNARPGPQQVKDRADAAMAFAPSLSDSA